MLLSCSSDSDRTCTVLNVEGDAFGAGILQHFVDKSEKGTEGTELSEVRLEDTPASAATLEDSPLIQKKREAEASARRDDRESIM